MISRRRFMLIAAAACSSPAQGAELQAWNGQALGSAARIVLSGVTPVRAARVFRKVEAIVRQVEAQFSLHRDSELVRLNRIGNLSNPPADMAALFALAGEVHEATAGVFDPSIQPLWLALATGGDAAAARDLIGWKRVRHGDTGISLDRGMQLTFNGIAQGHAADRVARLMRAEGFANVLIDMGEVSALGERPGGGGWRAEIALPDGQSVASLPLNNRALATSAPRGTLIGVGLPHILNPAGTAPVWQLASVSAPSAAVADALSTAFCLMDRAAIDQALRHFPDSRLEALV